MAKYLFLASCILLLSLHSVSVVSGACTACDAGDGDCVDDVCYCKALKMGPNCTAACGACAGDEVCNAATTCAACAPVCANGECRTVDATPTCMCPVTHTGAGCALRLCGTNTCDAAGGDGTCDTTDPTKCKCVATHVGDDCSRLEKCGTNICDLTGGDGTCTGNKCDCNDGYTGDDCSSLASSLLVAWAVLVLGVWSAIKLY